MNPNKARHPITMPTMAPIDNDIAEGVGAGALCDKIGTTYGVPAVVLTRAMVKLLVS